MAEDIETNGEGAPGGRKTFALAWAPPKAFSFIGLAYVVVAVVGLMVFVLYPRAPHAVNAHVAQIWSDSISNLDIAPIYPPREDFYLGDVYATISQTPPGFESFRGKAIRVGQVDVSEAVRTSCKYAAEKCDAEGALPRDHIVGFPAFKISSAANASLDFAWGQGSVGGSSRNNHEDELSIKKATTRDADASETLKAVHKYCGDPKTTEHCSDYLARYLLYTSSTQDRGIVDYKNIDVYCQWRIELYIATRLYLTTKIHHEYRAGSNSGAKMEAGKVGGGKPAMSAGGGGSADSEVGSPDDEFDHPVAFGWQYLLIHPYQNREIPECPDSSASPSH